MYWYLPNRHKNVKYDIFSCNVKLWCPKLMSIKTWSISCLLTWVVYYLVLDLMLIGLIGAVISLAGSRHSLTFPFAITCCLSTLSSSSFNGSYKAYASLLGGTWYGWLLSLTYNVTIPKEITELIMNFIHEDFTHFLSATLFVLDTK